MKIMGYKKPKIETNESIEKFLVDGGVTPDNIMHIDSTASHWYYRRSSVPMSGMEIYNSDGMLVRKLEEGECSGTMVKSLANYDIDQFKAQVINSQYLDTVLKPFEMPDGRKLTKNDFKSTDFIVCIYYGKYEGKQYLNTIKFMSDEINKNPERDRLKVYYLNVDMHECWKIKDKSDNRRFNIFH